MSLGKKIKRERKKWKLSIDSLAKKVGCSKSYLWEIENNPKTKPSADLVYKISLALKLDIRRLLDDRIPIESVEGTCYTNLNFQIEIIRCEKTVQMIQNYVDLLLDKPPFVIKDL